MNPRFLSARAAERRQRVITYLPHPPALVLPLCVPRYRCLKTFRYRFWWALTRGRTAQPVSHFTERQRLELCFSQNAFFCGMEPAPGDVFGLLWRIHPDFIRPDGELPNRRHPGHAPCYATLPARLRSWRARRALSHLLPRLDLRAAVAALNRWLALAEQDQPARDDDSPVRPFSAMPEICPWDDLCDYYGRSYGLTPDVILDSPRAWLFQLHRNRLLSQPDGHLSVIAPSDSLLSTH